MNVWRRHVLQQSRRRLVRAERAKCPHEVRMQVSATQWQCMACGRIQELPPRPSNPANLAN